LSNSLQNLGRNDIFEQNFGFSEVVVLSCFINNWLSYKYKIDFNDFNTINFI